MLGVQWHTATTMRSKPPPPPHPVLPVSLPNSHPQTQKPSPPLSPTAHTYTKLSHTKRCKDCVTYSLLPPWKLAMLLVCVGRLMFERCTHSAWRTGGGATRLRLLCRWSVKTGPDLRILQSTECVLLWNWDHTGSLLKFLTSERHTFNRLYTSTLFRF